MSRAFNDTNVFRDANGDGVNDRRQRRAEYEESGVGKKISEAAKGALRSVKHNPNGALGMAVGQVNPWLSTIFDVRNADFNLDESLVKMVRSSPELDMVLEKAGLQRNYMEDDDDDDDGDEEQASTKYDAEGNAIIKEPTFDPEDIRNYLSTYTNISDAFSGKRAIGSSLASTGAGIVAGGAIGSLVPMLGMIGTGAGAIGGGMVGNNLYNNLMDIDPDEVEKILGHISIAAAQSRGNLARFEEKLEEIDQQIATHTLKAIEEGAENEMPVRRFASRSMRDDDELNPGLPEEARMQRDSFRQPNFDLAV